MRPPATSCAPESASRRSIASTSCGTIDPPKTLANASPTVDSSLRSMRSTRPISPPALLVVVLRSRSRGPVPRVAWPLSLLAWYRPRPAVRDQQNSENQVGAGQLYDLAGGSGGRKGFAAVGGRGGAAGRVSR